MSKLNDRLKKRKKNFYFLKDYLKKKNNDNFILPSQQKGTNSGWLAFPIVLKARVKNLRNNFQKFLEKRNIQTRVIFSGDITKQPFMKNEKYTLKKGINKNANFIMQNGILIGCHQLLKLKELKYSCHSITQFINKNLK